MYMMLSPRLQRIASYVRNGDRVIDVGTDHAYIPIYLLLNRISDLVTATDIKPGPLQRAAADAAKYAVSDRLQLLLCDGLSGCVSEMADCIILAGMGGETIRNILSAAPWAWEKRLILQPQTKQAELRDWLAQHGLAVTDASLVYDTGRIYLIYLAERGLMRPCVSLEPSLLEKHDPLLRPYIEDRIKRLRKQINGMEQGKAADADALHALHLELDDLLKNYEEVQTWQV